MKKRLIIIGIAVVAIFGVVKAKEYYDSRYVTDGIYYIKVPSNQSMDLEDILDSNGKVVDKGKSYTFTGYDENGKSMELFFTFITDNKVKLLKPGQYVKVKASKTISLGEEIINEADVPESVLKILNK